MKKIVLSLLAMVAVTAAIAQTTLIVPGPKCTAVTTVTCQSTTVTVPTGTTTPTPPVSATYWIYKAGVFNWTSDYSWNATINYKDTSQGSTAIGVTIIGQYGGFQPYLAGGFDTSPYIYLTYCTKPTKANQIHGTGIAAVNDVADGTPISIVAGPGTTKYGPIPTVGVWGCYKIPLADFGLTNKVILKFNITDGTGLSSNLFYVDNVGFL